MASDGKNPVNPAYSLLYFGSRYCNMSLTITKKDVILAITPFRFGDNQAPQTVRQSAVLHFSNSQPSRPDQPGIVEAPGSDFARSPPQPPSAPAP